MSRTDFRVGQSCWVRASVFDRPDEPWSTETFGPTGPQKMLLGNIIREVNEQEWTIYFPFDKTEMEVPKSKCNPITRKHATVSGKFVMLIPANERIDGDGSETESETSDSETDDEGDEQDDAELHMPKWVFESITDDTRSQKYQFTPSSTIPFITTMILREKHRFFGDSGTFFAP